MSYARTEIAGRMRWKWKPDSARGGCVKEAIREASRYLKISWHRARDLMRAKAKPSVEEMDLVRALTPDFPNSQIAKADPHEVARAQAAEDRLVAIQMGLNSLAEEIAAYRKGLPR